MNGNSWPRRDGPTLTIGGTNPNTYAGTTEVVTGTVQRREGRNVIINLGKLDALLPVQEQVETEPYRFNDRIKVYILEVRDAARGPQVIVSRSHGRVRSWSA